MQQDGTYERFFNKIVGVAWLEDGVTIKCMPLLNMLALCREVPGVVISIFDCNNHMTKGGKDAKYILHT